MSNPAMRQLFLPLLCCALAPAQVFIVDVNNGPGTNFTSIAAAVAAVPDGAVLRVRAGTYANFTIGDQSLAILADPGVLVSAVTAAPITVDGLSAGKAVTLRGLSWIAPIGQPTATCRFCAGTVVFDACLLDFATVFTGGRIQVFACDRVFIRDSRFEASGSQNNCIESTQSNVAVHGCWLRASNRAIEQFGGRVHLSDCHLESTGNSFWGSTLVYMNPGELLVNANTTFVGSPNTPTPAVGGYGSAVIDPSTVLQMTAVPPYTTNISATARAVPRLDAATQGLGGTATATLHFAVPAFGVLAAGFPTTPYQVPWAMDPFWLDSTAQVRVAGTGSPLSHSYQVPNATWVLGLQIAWQGAVLNVGLVALSNPAVYAHH